MLYFLSTEGEKIHKYAGRKAVNLPVSITDRIGNSCTIKTCVHKEIYGYENLTIFY